MVNQFLEPVLDDQVSTGWLCPDVDSMMVQNFFGSTIAGYSSYIFSVKYCDAVASDLGYDDPNCETNRTLTN
jgi:hypothetical protein